MVLCVAAWRVKPAPIHARIECHSRFRRDRFRWKVTCASPARNVNEPTLRKRVLVSVALSIAHLFVESIILLTGRVLSKNRVELSADPR